MFKFRRSKREVQASIKQIEAENEAIDREIELALNPPPAPGPALKGLWKKEDNAYLLYGKIVEPGWNPATAQSAYTPNKLYRVKRRHLEDARPYWEGHW